MDIIYLDLETFYATGYSLTGLTYPEYLSDDRFLIQGVGIAINDGEIEYFPEHEVEAAIADLDLENSTLVTQNSKFDASILAWKFGRYAKFYIDTMDLSRLHWPGQDASLDLICKRLWPDNPAMHKGKELADFKGFRDLNEAQQEVMGGYCMQDVRLTRAIADELIPLTPKDELRLMDLTLRMYIQPSFQLDAPRVERFLESEREETKRLIEESGIKRTVLSSNKQFVEWMEGQDIDVPTKISPSTGKETPALGQKDPEFLSLMADHPKHKAVWTARAAVKSTINVSRGQRLMDLHTTLGTIPVPLSAWGAHTGRWSGTQKINMQNMPRGGELRKSLVVPEDKRIHVVDSAQIEARVLAWLAGQMDLLEDFRNKEDVYSKMASSIYGYKVDRKLKLEDGSKPFEEEGNVGKVSELGLGYGMGNVKYRHTLASGPMGTPPILVSTRFAEHAVNTYRMSRVNIVNLWHRMGKAAYDMMIPGCDYWIGPLHITFEQIGLPNGTALKYPNLRLVGETDTDGNPTGRRNLVCDRKRGTTQKLYGGVLTENAVQALARIVVSDQALDAVFRFSDSTLALLVHDEGVFVMPYTNESDSKERQEELEEIFRSPPQWAPDLPLDSEGGFALEYSK